MRFRPCIDLHQGKVKQIVGSTLNDDDPDGLKTNFVADASPAWFAKRYKRDNLVGGHIIMLGPGNEQVAAEALSAWPGGMQIGGGINVDNAAGWLDRGASHVIVTSWVFKDGVIDRSRLNQLVRKIGRERLVLDLSCRRRGVEYCIVTNRWQKFTDVAVNKETLDDLSAFCDEFLIHAADVEGKCAGVEQDLVAKLGHIDTIPVTYAGGVRNIEDLETIKQIGRNRLDATIGSSLDIFGGTSITYEEAVLFHNSNQ